MGIPSFFSYIVKQHTKNVLYRNIDKLVFQYLFIDANSLIYDVINKPPPTSINLTVGGQVMKDDDTIIDEVGQSLEKLIAHIGPTIKTYIAFDGICPFSKMKHQKNRRLKSYLLNPPLAWDTTKITPGTPFMSKLTTQLRSRFATNEAIFFSGTDDIGEGESKICRYIREIYATIMDKKTLPMIAFYGLDNDIIMLSILHLYCAENIFVFREEMLRDVGIMGKSVSNVVAYMYINIKGLVDSILYEMNCADRNVGRVIDYVFMCFFLGNDFLPKFPAIQIRTHGITLLLDTYREHIGKYHGRRLVNYRPIRGGGGKGGGSGVINWGWVSLFIQKLAIVEHDFMVLETETRNKMEASMRRGGNVTMLEDRENVPMMYREVERYVSPEKTGWEWRYYKALFDVAPTPESLKGWCVNYLEGLEWTFRYYTGVCPDWQWMYHDEYSPLLRDLAMCVPRAYDWEYFPNVVDNPSSLAEQLAYVMPPCGEDRAEMAGKVCWKWAYCRYLWEAHVVVV